VIGNNIAVKIILSAAVRGVQGEKEPEGERGIKGHRTILPVSGGGWRHRGLTEINGTFLRTRKKKGKGAGGKCEIYGPLLK